MRKKTVFILPILAVLLLGSTAAVADGGSFSSKNTIVYPVKNPIFSVTFPDNWDTETENDIIHATPNDSSIYLGIWALEDANTLDAALDELDKAIASLVKNLKAGEAESAEINGIRFLTVDGTGRDEEGDNVNVSAALFSPDEKQIFIMLYYATPEAEKLHEDELVGILKSINGEE
jgi:hypothetical protein